MSKQVTIKEQEEFRRRHYKNLQRKHLARLILTYLLPMILLVAYFEFQYNQMLTESRTMHFKSVAENQANMLDLFLNERAVNLINLIDDPKLEIPPSISSMKKYLEKLKKDSEAFSDLDFFNSEGLRVSHAGEFSSLEKRDYSNENWYLQLNGSHKRFIITDIYLGYRRKPHFTIAVSRYIGDSNYVLRATLDHSKIYDYIKSIEKSTDANISIVNQKGYYQVVTENVGQVLNYSSIIPPPDKTIGYETINQGKESIEFAYAWLGEVMWAVIVQPANAQGSGVFLGIQFNIITVIFSIIVILTLFAVILVRSRQIATIEQEKDVATEEKEIVVHQLEHASKLASIGELASGIAHEINNPLAVIGSKIGLVQDLMNPEFNPNPKFSDIEPHLSGIHDAVFRCRDITRKLLSFVRQNEYELKEYNLNAVLNDVADNFFEHELSLSNIEIIKRYDNDLPGLVTDANLLKQVFINIMNNARDAIEAPGKITLFTLFEHSRIMIGISDTGKGITKEQIEKIFLPFYTTKEVGKGTGLGLSVSYGIIKNLGGEIEVESTPGTGSTFRIIFPIVKQ